MRREFSPSVRQAAYLRAKYRCERCESKFELQLHHIGDPSDNSLFNAQVLCMLCHNEEHARRKKYAYSYWL
jgi:5-methylcytosine-specific restriction endonuclease McrA